MLKEFEAVYENGVLRPLQPLPLSEREYVKVTVARAADQNWLDAEFMDACGAEADSTISLEQVRRSLAKIRGSMDEAINEDRGES
jgi:predicted DNA-binding antitoxin AbrB/MazE fold protein